MLSVIQQRLMLVLTVDVDQMTGHRPQLTHRHCHIIDPAYVSSVRDPSGQNECSILLRIYFLLAKQLDPIRILHHKHQLNQCIIAVFSDTIPAHFAAECRIYRVDQNGFTCTGLSGEDIEPRFQIYIRLINQRKVFYMNG